MNNELKHAYQQALIYACLDDFTGSSALSGVLGGQHGPHIGAWKQASIDFIYRNLITNLIEVSPYQKSHRGIEPKNLCEMLAKDELNSNLTGVSTLWVGVYFDGTLALEALVRKHKMLEWEFLNAPIKHEFLGEIFDLYRKSGIEI